MKSEIVIEPEIEIIHTHPTLSEAVLEAAQAACGQAIHMLPAKDSHG